MRLAADSSWFTFELQPGPEYRVFAFSGHEEAHEPYEFEIELVHDSPNVNFAEVLGRSACLRIADKSGDSRLVHGVVRSFAQLHTGNKI